MTDHDTNPSRKPPGDELDVLLRRWHDVNAERAAAGRDTIIAAIRDERRAARRAAAAPRRTLGDILVIVRRTLVNRYSPAIASLMFLVVIAALLMPSPRGRAMAREIMVPEGGKLEAFDAAGNVLGPCPLKHTDVVAEVSGFFTRVNVTQTYTNPYQAKIEAVYTFPLSHRAAVDRMTMTVGDRVVEGEVKEKAEARQIYESARKQGYVASLLEQERPNIFTQSVANIEPGAQVVVNISYVETLQSVDGTYTFDFPMVVGPRYIPGAPTVSQANVPAELKARPGVILAGPATLTVGAAGDLSALGSLQAGKLQALLEAAQPVAYPGDTWWGKGDATGGAGQGTLWYRFEAAYCDGSRELGELYTDGTGEINGRWFYTDPKAIEGMGTGFNQDTNQVPDASRITPQPVRPGTRAGHDVSVKVTIDAGGPGVSDVTSALHEITRADGATRDDGLPKQVTVTLADRDEIPNRDFVLSWRETSDAIQEAVLTHTADNLGDWSGGFFTLILQPPARIEDAAVSPRELVFVMDTSGSMRGLPIEKSKEVMTRAIAAMRPLDTFNVITFSGSTAVLWTKPRPATEANRAEARDFIENQLGRGGTEMMQAIDAALVQGPGDGNGVITLRQLADLPADGRTVEVAANYEDIQTTAQADRFRVQLGQDLDVQLRLGGDLPPVLQPHGVTVRMSGRWLTENGRRVFAAGKTWLEGQAQAAAAPMRIALFFTDGYVGNDMAIIDAVRRNAGTTRVFSFGIGNSVNRWLLERMAREGRGEVEFVLLNGGAGEADEAAARLAKRIQTPVLTDIRLAYSPGLEVLDTIPAQGAIPDLFDAKPLVIHGRYKTPGKGTVTISGLTGAGPWQRSVELELPQAQPQHDVIATLWARAKVDEILAPNLQALQQNQTPHPVQAQVVALGERFSMMTQFTSFVAVEKSRMTIGGQPVLVAVPIEMPDGVSWEGVFGGGEGVGVGGRDEFAARSLERADAQRAGEWEVGRPMSGHVSSASAVDAKGKREAPGPGKSTADVSTRGRLDDAAVVGQSAGGELALRRAPVARQDVAPASTAPIPPGAPANPPPPTSPVPAEPPAGQAAPARPAPGAGGAVYLSERAYQPKSILSAKIADGAPAADVNALSGNMSFPWQLAIDGDADVDAMEANELQGDIPALAEIFKKTQDERAAAGNRPVLVQDAALGIAARVEDNKVTDAAKLAEYLVVLRPGYDVGQKMNQALKDGTLDDARLKVISEQALVARRQLADIERQMRLHRVLDAALLAMLQTPQDQEVTLGIAVKELAEEDKSVNDRIAGRRPEPMLLTILVTDVAKTRAALEAAGLEIVNASRSLPIIVGRADVSRLEALAMVEGVRRIEPTRMTPGKITPGVFFRK